MSYLIKTFNEKCQEAKKDCGKNHFSAQKIYENKNFIKWKCTAKELHTCNGVSFYMDCNRTWWTQKEKMPKERKREGRY